MSGVVGPTEEGPTVTISFPDEGEEAAATRTPRDAVGVTATTTAPGDDDEEELCGICLEKPPVDGFVRLWCCHNILCVTDAQHIGRCPFCRTEPLVWEIEK